MDQLDGILAVNKPAGWTSHDVVAKLRRLLRMKRIGHAGTLDPDVTGVLPLAVGRSTRFIEYMQEMPKEYVADMVIGIATDTEDMSGTVIARIDRAVIAREQLERVLSQFVGEIEQIPPMYSAVKVDGRRLYELAREGREVERKARKVKIHEIRIEEADLAPDHPKIRFRVRCSKGTYIRTLCKDIGEALGFPAVMAGLVRTMSCGIDLSQSLTLQEITELLDADKLSQHVMPADAVLVDIPAVHVEEESIAVRLLQGQKVKLSDAPVHQAYDQDLVRIYAPSNQFIGICRLVNRVVIPHKMFHS